MPSLIQTHDRETAEYRLKIVPVYYPSSWNHLCLVTGSETECRERAAEYLSASFVSHLRAGEADIFFEKWPQLQRDADGLKNLVL